MVSMFCQGTAVNIFEFFMDIAHLMPVAATTTNQPEIFLTYCSYYNKNMLPHFLDKHGTLLA